MIEPRRKSLISGHGLLAATSAFTPRPERRVTPLGYAKAALFTVGFPAATAILAWRLIDQMDFNGPTALMASLPATVALVLGFIAARNTLKLTREDAAGVEALQDDDCLLDLRSVLGERREWLYENDHELAANPAADATLALYADGVKDEFERFMKGHIGGLDPVVTRLEDRLAATLAEHAHVA